MPSVQSDYGRIGAFEDFMGIAATFQIADATAGTRYNDICLVAVSGTNDIDFTVDEPNGVISFNGAGGAADGIAIVGSPMRPDRNGTMVMTARFKNASASDFRCFAGFQQTVSLSETVNPWTLSGTTLTSNAAGEVAGFYFDTQATTKDFRFLTGANSAADTSAAVVVGDHVKALNSNATTLGSLGIRAGITQTADKYTTVRVEMDPDGGVRGYIGDETVVGSRGLKMVAYVPRGPLSTTTLYFPVLQLLAQSTGDPIAECDFFGWEGRRYWGA